MSLWKLTGFFFGALLELVCTNCLAYYSLSKKVNIREKHREILILLNLDDPHAGRC